MKYFRSILLLSIAFISFIVLPHTLESANLGSVYLRFDRMTPNTATTAMLCAKPATNAVENSVDITFPSDFTINSSAAAWTVSTANIPSDASPWPGIGTATSVAGQTVSFPSGDLGVGTQYCFQITNSGAMTTGNIGNELGTVTTRTAALGVIDSSDYSIVLQGNDSVALSASIPASPSDIRLTQTTVPPDGTTLSTGDEVTVTLAYGSSIHMAEPFNLVAGWDQGLVDGSSSNYVDVFEYVPGSATTTDDGTPPVIDLQNRTITWSIPSLVPSVSDHIVTYKIRIRSDITTYTLMTTQVHSQGQLGSTFSSEQVSNFNVLIPEPVPTATPTPTPTTAPVPTTTPGVAATPTPAPTTIPTQLRLVRVELREITDSSAQVYLLASKDAAVKVLYGKDRSSLLQQASTKTTRRQALLNLSDLSPNTQYYLRIQLKDETGKVVTSDLYSFRTASKQSFIQLSRENTTVFWKDILLNTPQTTRIPVPPGKPLTFVIHTDNSDQIADARLSFRNSNVLGVFSLNSPTPVGEVRLVQLSPGTFSGSILSPDTKGVYSVPVKIKDIYGGFTTALIPITFLIVDPVTVTDKTTHKPIENASIEVLKLDQSSQLYTDLGSIFSIGTSTDTKGEEDMVFPQGEFRLNVKTIGYTPSQLNFSITNSSSQYPKIELESNFTFVTRSEYYLQSFKESMFYLKLATTTFTSSTTMQSLTHLIMMLAILFTLIIGFLMKSLQSISLLLRQLLIIIGDGVVLGASLLTLAFILGIDLSSSWSYIVLWLILISIWAFILKRVSVESILKKISHS